MDILQHLGIALGLATLSGLNLYLTVLAAGMAIREGWVALPAEYHDLAILGHPAVLLVAGGLCLVQFVADKVPWLDSLWDLLHTLIRPLGGAFLATRVFGDANPALDTVIALMAGGVTLTTHGAKAGTRLLVNGSPEPFSNIALSLTEDAAVCGGLGVLAFSFWKYPWLALAVFSSLFGTLLLVTPRVWRFLRIRLWLFWKKLSSPASGARAVVLAKELPAEAERMLCEETLSTGEIAWAAPCLTGSSKEFPANVRGWLVAPAASPGKLVFVGRRGWRRVARTLDLSGLHAAREPRFLSEDLCLQAEGEKRPRHVFVFDRSRARLVKDLVEMLNPGTADHAAGAELAQLTGVGPERSSEKF